MTNAEIIATIRNEIERLKKNENDLIENSTKKYGAYPASSDIMLIAYQNVLSILSTIEKSEELSAEQVVEGEVILNGHGLLADVTKWGDGYKLKVIIKED